MGENLPNKIDQLFKDALTKFTSDASGKVWNKIEEGLDEEDRKMSWFSFGWKRYATAAVLLVTGLALLSKIYFRQEAIFNLESKLREITVKPSVISPKLNLPDSRNDTKTGPHVGDNETKKGVSPFVIADIKEKTTANEFQIGTLAEIMTQSTLPMVSTQPLESRLQLLPVSQPGLPAKEMKDQPLLVTHQKMPFKNRLSVTPYFSQEFAGYSLTDNDLAGVNGQEIEERERNVFSASVGFFINYRINKRWVLQSGISYSWSNSNIDSATSLAVKDNQGIVQYKLNTIAGFGYLHPDSSIQPNVGDSVSTAKSYSQLHYLSIPLILSYRIPWSKFSLLIGAGASFNVLTSAEIETKTYGNGGPEKEYSVKMMGLNKVNYGMILKLDLEYRINSHLGVDIIPCFKNTLSPINLESALTAYPYNFGIGAGVTYRF